MAAIIFDFDGTIANTFDYTVGFLAREAGRPPLSKEERTAMHGVSMGRIGRQLGISWPRMSMLFFKGRREMSPAMKNVEPFGGMPDVIRQLHGQKHELYILSTNTTRNINKFLQRHELDDYFKDVYGGVGMFGKAPALRRLLREQHIETRKAIYIGDELRDVLAAQSLEVRVIAVTWGFARLDDLKAQKVNGLAWRTADIVRLVDKLESSARE